MVVVLVLLTFAVLIGVEVLASRRRSAALSLEGEQLHHDLEEGTPDWVAGFRLPPTLRYHPGHTWVHAVSPTEAFVGLDDFARRLLGKDTRLCPPERGTRLAQGQRAIRVEREGMTARLASPVGGEVVGINPKLDSDPEIGFRESYGRGWLFKIRSKRLAEDLSNLLQGSLARRWMEDTRDRFQHRLILATGTVLQDGGTPVEDIAGAMSRDDWRRTVDEFLSLETERPSL